MLLYEYLRNDGVKSVSDIQKISRETTRTGEIKSVGVITGGGFNVKDSIVLSRSVHYMGGMDFASFLIVRVDPIEKTKFYVNTIRNIDSGGHFLIRKTLSIPPSIGITEITKLFSAINYDGWNLYFSMRVIKDGIEKDVAIRVFLMFDTCTIDAEYSINTYQWLGYAPRNDIKYIQDGNLNLGAAYSSIKREIYLLPPEITPPYSGVYIDGEYAIFQCGVGAESRVIVWEYKTNNIKEIKYIDSVYTQNNCQLLVIPKDFPVDFPVMPKEKSIQNLMLAKNVINRMFKKSIDI